MNAGTLSLPSGQTARRVTGLVRATGVLNGISLMASTARALQTSVTAPASDVNSLVLAASVSGRGQINWCATSTSSGGGNIRTVLEVDGVIIFDQTATTVSANNGHLVVGGGFLDASTGMSTAVLQPIQFQSGFRLLIGHSAIGTTLNAFVNAEVHA